MIVAALLVAALSVEPQVFPEPLCENLPEVRPEVKTWVAHVAPELAQVQVRELPEKTALDVFGRAAVAGWGSIDVLTNSVFREPCTFYFSREALRAVDAAFVLDLMTVIRGQDKKGQAFEMAALLAGRGKLVVLYDRDGIVYRNERLARDFTLASRVEFETPAAGVLGNVQGLCAKVLLLGCVRVRSLVKVGKTLEVHAGTFTSETPLKPIHAREGRSGLPTRNQGKPAVPEGADRGMCRNDRGPLSALAQVVSEQSDFAFQRANALGDACVAIRLRAQATVRTGRLTGGRRGSHNKENTQRPSCRAVPFGTPQPSRSAPCARVC
jgi:hypothetical protein